MIKHRYTQDRTTTAAPITTYDDNMRMLASIFVPYEKMPDGLRRMAMVRLKDIAEKNRFVIEECVGGGLNFKALCLIPDRADSVTKDRYTREITERFANTVVRTACGTDAYGFSGIADVTHELGMEDNSFDKLLTDVERSLIVECEARTRYVVYQRETFRDSDSLTVQQAMEENNGSLAPTVFTLFAEFMEKACKHRYGVYMGDYGWEPITAATRRLPVRWDAANLDEFQSATEGYEAAIMAHSPDLYAATMDAAAKRLRRATETHTGYFNHSFRYAFFDGKKADVICPLNIRNDIMAFPQEYEMLSIEVEELS